MDAEAPAGPQYRKQFDEPNLKYTRQLRSNQNEFYFEELLSQKNSNEIESPNIVQMTDALTMATWFVACFLKTLSESMLMLINEVRKGNPTVNKRYQSCVSNYN